METVRTGKQIFESKNPYEVNNEKEAENLGRYLAHRYNSNKDNRENEELYSIPELEWREARRGLVSQSINREYAIVDKEHSCWLVVRDHRGKIAANSPHMLVEQAKAAANAHHKEQLSKYLTPERGE